MTVLIEECNFESIDLSRTTLYKAICTRDNYVNDTIITRVRFLFKTGNVCRKPVCIVLTTLFSEIVGLLKITILLIKL